MSHAIAAFRRGKSRVWFGAFLFVMSVAAGSAEASPRQVERALALYNAGQLTRALTAFERALSSGDNADADLPTIYRHLGELRAGSGDTAGSEEAFRKLLELDATATPSPEWSPVILEPFERARAAVVPQPPPEPPEEPAPEPEPIAPAPLAPSRPPRSPLHGSLGPSFDARAWTAPDELRTTGVFGSGWFWAGAGAFVAAAVAVAILNPFAGEENP